MGRHDFASLFYPETEKVFLRDYWEKKHWIIARGRDDFYSDLLGVGNLDSLLSLSSFNTPSDQADVRLVKTENGKSVSQRVVFRPDGRLDIFGVYAAVQAGFTLIVNRLEFRWTAIAQLCRNLEAALNHRVSANLYYTPPDSQGFSPHYDTHDVLVLQLAGSKLWRLYHRAQLLPLADADVVVARASLSAPVEEKILNAGDLLYLPRGQVHEALTAGGASLHLTVGIYALCWFHLIQEAVRKAARSSVELREALPPGWFNGSHDRPMNEAKWRALLDQFCATADLARAWESLGNDFLTSSSPPPDGHFASIERAETLALESPVRKRSGIACVSGIVHEQAVISFCGKSVRGPRHLIETFRFIATNGQFLVKDLPGGLSDSAKVVLAKRLVREGLLAIDPEGA